MLLIYEFMTCFLQEGNVISCVHVWLDLFIHYAAPFNPKFAQTYCYLIEEYVNYNFAKCLLYYQFSRDKEGMPCIRMYPPRNVTSRYTKVGRTIWSTWCPPIMRYNSYKGVVSLLPSVIILLWSLHGAFFLKERSAKFWYNRGWIALSSISTQQHR